VLHWHGKEQLHLGSRKLILIRLSMNGPCFVDSKTLSVGMDGAPTSMGVMRPKIIYSSRTHSQLAQVVRELKNTSYRYINHLILIYHEIIE
jgi:hypothetical protein